MVPGQYVLLERIPTTSNGKPDRARLPAPSWGRDLPRARGQRPSTPAESDVAALWCEVLGCEAVGIQDDFFALGGTSLTLVRLFSLLERRYPGTVRVAQLFARPTVAGQALLVAPATRAEAAPKETDIDF